MVAACAARNGHSVLHVDINDFYGGEWAAFNFEGIQEWIDFHHHNTSAEESFYTKEKGSNDKAQNKSTPVDLESFLKENEKLFLYSFKNFDSCISDVRQQWHISDEELQKFNTQSSVSKDDIVRNTENELENATVSKESSSETQVVPDLTENPLKSQENDKSSNELQDTEEGVRKEQNDVMENAPETGKEETSNKKNRYPWTRKKIINCSRKFNLDLVPRLLYSRGAMVDLLISSNISRYTEFKVTTRVRRRTLV